MIHFIFNKKFLLCAVFAFTPILLRADVVSQLSVPPGFTVSLYAEGLGNPRGMTLSPEGVLYVCDMGNGRVLALSSPEETGSGDKARVVLEGLHHPHSLAFYQGHLYVGEIDRVSRFSIVDYRQSREDGKTVVELPPGGGHSTRTILFGPDDKLYISIGSTCNRCVEKDERRAAICRCNPDGSQFEVFAKGLRNAVGIAFRPGIQDLWASCNGRDMLGDDLPPECFYKVEEGKNYGWPDYYFLNGKPIKDRDSHRKVAPPTGAPVFEYQAHCAPLGIRFYTGSVFPEKYHHGFFACFHGSWNRSVRVGYKVIFLPITENGKAGKAEDFLTGFLRPNYEVIGRPVDNVTGPHGELFVSDDDGGKILKISYSAKGSPDKQ